MRYFSSFLIVSVIVLIVAGCKSQPQITGKEIGCNTRDVEIIDSEFKRMGSLTTWCASCEDRIYQCITNPGRDRIECRRVEVGPPCQ